MTQLNLGHCGLCEQKIWYKEGNRVITSNKYAEVYFMLSDETVMRSSICTDCLNTLTDQTAKKLLERIKDTWHTEMVGWATDSKFKRMRKIKLESWDRAKVKAIEKYKVKRKKIKEKKCQEI